MIMDCDMLATALSRFFVSARDRDCITTEQPLKLLVRGDGPAKIGVSKKKKQRRKLNLRIFSYESTK